MSSSRQSRPALLRPDLDVLDQVLVGLLRVAERVVDAVGDLAGELEGLRAAHRPDHERETLLHRPGEGEEPAVLVELAVEGDRAVVEERAHDVVRLLDPGERLDLRPVDAVLGEQPEVADREDAFRATARELVQGRKRLAEQRRLTEPDPRQARAEVDSLRLVRGRGEQDPEILVPGLVRRIAGVVPELVRLLDHLDRVGERIVKKCRVAELHVSCPPRPRFRH